MGFFKAKSMEPDRQMPTNRDTTPELYCAAHGCPMRWSVSVNRACSYHAWKPVNEWPSITEDLLRSGPWKLRSTTEDTPTVRDMKSRVKGHIGNVG